MFEHENKRRIERYKIGGSIIILFRNELPFDAEVDEYMDVSNGQFPVSIHVMEASVTPHFPDLLHIQFEKVFSIASTKSHNEKELYQMIHHILNDSNLHIDMEHFAFKNEIIKATISWNPLKKTTSLELDDTDYYNE